jgi:hypothetical protein
MLVELKINGMPLVADTDKMHQSWVDQCLMYGVRRYVNDSHSGAKGQDKYDACRMMIADMVSGEAMPERVRKTGGSSADPVEQLAMRNARAALTALFKRVTGKAKAVDMATHEKVAPFFAVADGKATWVDETVRAWVDKQAADGKVDYFADAQATIDMADDDDDAGLDF